MKTGSNSIFLEISLPSHMLVQGFLTVSNLLTRGGLSCAEGIVSMDERVDWPRPGTTGVCRHTRQPSKPIILFSHWCGFHFED